MESSSEPKVIPKEVFVDELDVDLAATDDTMATSAEPNARTGSAKVDVLVPGPSKIDGFSANAVPAKNTEGWPVGVHAGILIVFVSVCLAWLLWVLALTVQPTKIMNSIMNTKDFDYGTFWLIYEPPRAIVAVGVAGLAFVAAGYLGVVSAVVVLLVKGSTTPLPGPRFDSINLGVKVTNSNAHRSSSRTESIKRVAKQAAMEITNRESKTRRTMALVAKTAEIFVQCVVLAQLLEDGMPVGLCGLFSAIVILNALTSSIFCLLPYDNMGLVHVFTDTAYDFVVAVAFPLLQVLDARRRFTFDRALFKINREMFPEGTFERTELTIADPTEVEIIVHVIDLVRINSLLKIFTRVGTSVSLLLRCTRLVEVLRAKQAGVIHHPNEYPKKSRLPAALFTLAAIAIIVTTEESVRTSRAACAMHPSCVQHAHRWVAGREEDDFTKCYCMAMIDRDITLASYDEWVAPPDRTQTIAQLATPGHLQTIQLVNRGLATIPEQLRECKNLKHVSLYYTNTQTLPDWFGELTNLQFLHIEGKSFGPTPQQSLQSMPANLFDKMDSLLFLHLAALPLSSLPSFDGLTNIRSMALAVLYQVESLPSFDKLRNLERLTFAVMANLTVLPQLDHLEKLTSLVVADRGAFCCNGFLGTDRCNLTNSRCTYNVVSDMPAVTQCVSSADKMASAATLAVFDKFHFSTCAMRALMLNELEVPPSRVDMDQCNGTMYRQCVVPGYGVGMCYNPRWMAVSCYASPFAINMRRAQIAQKLGKPCNMEYEAWLGC